MTTSTSRAAAWTAAATASLALLAAGPAAVAAAPSPTSPDTDRTGRLASTYTAAVAPDGTLLRGRDALSSERTDDGTYVVRFEGDVSGCAYVGTITEHQGASGYVVTGGVADDPDAVSVVTHHITYVGDQGFSLDVRCEGRGPGFAVVDADGDLVRGDHVKRVHQTRLGRIQVKFDRRVDDTCAAVTTLGGSTAEEVEPGLLAAVTYLRPRTVSVYTTDEQGKIADRPFHLALTCGDSTRQPWVVLTDFGTIDAGPNAVGIEEVVEGVYDVGIRTSSGRCTMTAGLGEEQPLTDRGVVDLERRSYDDGVLTVRVRTRNTFLAPVPLAAHVSLAC